MKAAVIAIAGVMVMASIAPVAAADRPTEPDGDEPWADPEWPGQETTSENNTTVAPGQHLAGAVGAQGATVEGELWNRSLSERLANATGDADRARVLADEVGTIEAYVERLEAIRANLTEARDAHELSAGEYRSSVSELVIRARGVEVRANRTVRAAETLPEVMRDTYDVDLERARNLSTRARDLYRFDDRVGREVANETLDDGRDEPTLPAGERRTVSEA
ncbi:hypothetical protein [Halorussus marinus]|uniref:hypothetical protein n=1 Tax=Halorussus marinus TaxID=2505976 RepID=UPI001092DB21|nr:hypothetical protein [Halorussus marinus]